MFCKSGMRYLQSPSFRLVICVCACILHQVSAEEEVGSTEVAVAATLIGSISFIMVLYYFTNYNDTDIQAASWETISSTISIFCAVLLFQSFNDLTEAYIIDPNFGKEEATPGALFVDMIHMIFWYSMLQLLLAHLSGALNEDYMEELERDDKEKHKKKTTEMDLNVKCFAVLMAHITGFASINAWGTVQQFPFFKQSPHHAVLAVVLGITGQLVLQRITDTIRERIALSDDGKKSVYEDTWDRTCEEAEDDVMSLTVSFLAVNSLRFVISGCLPNQEGAEEECHVEEYLYNHTSSQKALLLGAGVFFTATIFVIVFNYPKSWLEEEEEDDDTDKEEEDEEEEEEKEKEERELLKRFANTLVISLSMSFSWAFFYGSQMVLAGVPFLKGKAEILAVVLALAVSLLGFTLLIVFDMMADADSSKILIIWDKLRRFKKDARRPSMVVRAKQFDDKVDCSIRQIMSAIGFAIGFSWEQCFDKSVDAIAVKSNESQIALINEHSVKLFLSIFCSLLLVPAWRMYMLPFVAKKGWRFGYLANIDDLYADHPDPEEKQELIEQARNLRKQIITAAKGKEKGEDGPSAEARKSRTTSNYRSLPGNDVDALRKEVADLRSQNTMLKLQLEDYQNMFDGHLDGHIEMLTKMSSAMYNLEQNKI